MVFVYCVFFLFVLSVCVVILLVMVMKVLCRLVCLIDSERMFVLFLISVCSSGLMLFLGSEKC